MATSTRTVTLPTYLASALINGDFSGLEDADVPAYEAAIALAAGGDYVDVADDEHFSKHNDLPGKLGCIGAQVATYTVLVFNKES